MGTRADFYVQRGSELVADDWIGSIAFDGYPSGIPPKVKRAATERGFRAAVAKFFSDREDVTLPKDGWPWPWTDSGTTDYAYIFHSNKVSWRARKHYPNMSAIQAVTLGKRSGLLVITG